MATHNPDLDDFVFGTRQLIATLPDQVDHATVKFTIRFLLLAVGTSPGKLAVLVNIIYETAYHGTQAAHLYLELFLQVQDHITATVLRKGNLPIKGSRLARVTIVNKCQEEYENVLRSLRWDRRSFDIIENIVLHQSRQVADVILTDNVLDNILSCAAQAEHLFEPHNFETFAHLLTTCGPALSKNATIKKIAPMLEKIAVRAAGGTLVQQLMVAGLLDMRDNNYNIRTRVKRTLAAVVDAGAIMEVEKN
ncbi:hypothetical protein EJ07DRAFT_184588 [Lizonia empirigonia]|nr:hypothetical protein EJ07DRAFT_184588 [Lizonia empirigonia]